MTLGETMEFLVTSVGESLPPENEGSVGSP